MKSFFLSILFVAGIVFPGLCAEAGFDIQIDVKNYQEDEVLIAYYYGDKQFIKDTISHDENGSFHFKGEERLEPGVYLLILLPDMEWIQFLVNEDQQNFQFEVNAQNLKDIKFKGSDDNKVFIDYINFLSKKKKLASQLEQRVAKADSLGKKDETAEQKLLELDEEVIAFQQLMVKKFPDYITSLLIKANFDIDIPKFSGDEKEVQNKRYYYYKQHYFDNIEMANPASLRTPFLFQKIKTFLDNITVQHPDSINIAVDRVLSLLQPCQESFRYYLSSLLNTYARSKIVGFDAIYVHIVENYYGKGLAPWVEEENLAKMVNEARLTKPILIGKTAPDFTSYMEDGTPVTLSKIDAEFIVLVFWAPDCGHCKKAIPFVTDFADKYKSKGVEVIALCNKTGDETQTCWESIKEKKMESLINLADEKDRSRTKYKYYVKSTPKIFILDRNKEILIKKIGAEQLESVMDEIIKFRLKENSDVK